MDIKKALSHRPRVGRKGMKGNTAELAAQLAPLEEQNKRTAARQIGSAPDSITSKEDPAYGAIVVDQEDMNLPRDIMEEGGGEKTFLGMEPVVLVILGFMLGFIAFIAWQVSQMPDK